MEKHLLDFTFILLLLEVLISLINLWKPNELARKISSLLMWLACFSLAGIVIFRTLAVNRVPFATLYEFTLLLVGFVLIVALVLRRTLSSPLLDLVVGLLLLVLLAISSTISTGVRPLMPALQSNWLHIHVGTAIIAYGAFAVAFCLGIMYLTTSQDSNTNLHSIDQNIYKLVVIGFTFLNIVIITGAVWAEEAWGKWWSWDPKETWSLVTWIVYAIYLHVRHTREWKGRKAAWMAVLGFLVVLFTLFGVSVLLPGLHSYV
ncbi:MAG: cytochrome c biogenesis protein CcsA [Syntrophomonadales bacterium]